MSLKTKLSNEVNKLELMNHDDIVKLFEHSKIKGKQLDVLNCPVNKYLEKKIGFKIRLSYPYIMIYDYRVDMGEEIFITTPSNLKDFIQRFDKGEFPTIIN